MSFQSGDPRFEQLSNYSSIMYRNFEGDNAGLRTGDIVRLGKADFKSILRNFPSFEPLINQYLSEKKYASKYWSVLNKSCDMVHDQTGRRFDTNLFLCPLQSFLSELKPDGLFKKYLEKPITVADYKSCLSTLVPKFNYYGS